MTRPGTTFPQARTGPRSAWRSPRSTAPPWNCSMTRRSRRNSGSPSPGAKPLLRLVGPAALRHPPLAGRRHRPLPRRGERPGRRAPGRFGPGQLNLADRGFFSMDRWIRFSGTGAHLLWRVKNGAKSVPFRTLRILKDGSELVLLRESTSMRARRRKAAGDRSLPSLPDTTARLVCFTVLTRTRSGRTRTSQIRLLTTLLDPDLHPARRTRRPVPETMDNRNRVPSPEADRPRYRPRPARTLRGPRPPGSLGAPARP